MRRSDYKLTPSSRGAPLLRQGPRGRPPSLRAIGALETPAQFKPVQGPFIACVWELEVTAHERGAWMRHALREDPDTNAYVADVLPTGSY